MLTKPFFLFQIWYENVPHPKLVDYKKDQHWVVKSGDYLVFPGGGTQFKLGVNHYIESIEKVNSLTLLFLLSSLNYSSTLFTFAS